MENKTARGLNKNSASRLTSKALFKNGVLEHIDGFGLPLPTFNLKGKQMVHTRIGGVCTLLITTIVLLYATIKFIHLQTRHNPGMSAYFKDTAPDFVVNLNEQKFRFAFSIEDFIVPKRLKNDPRYVKWIVRLFGRKQGVPY